MTASDELRLPAGLPVSPDMAPAEKVHRSGPLDYTAGAILFAVPVLFALAALGPAPVLALFFLIFSLRGLRMLYAAARFATVSGPDFVASREAGPWRIVDLRQLAGVDSDWIVGSRHHKRLVLRDRSGRTLTIWPTQLSPGAVRTILDRSVDGLVPVDDNAVMVLRQVDANPRP